MTNFDPIIAEKIVNYVRFGVSHETAALAAGIEISVLNEWKKAGIDKKDAECEKFIFNLERAAAQCELLHLQRLTAGGDGAANSKYILERISPRWSEKPQKRESSRTQTTPSDTRRLDLIKQLRSKK